MSYVLIIFMNIYGGTNAIYIPMATEELCNKNKQYLYDKYKVKGGLFSSSGIAVIECMRTADDR